MSVWGGESQWAGAVWGGEPRWAGPQGSSHWMSFRSIGLAWGLNEFVNPTRLAGASGVQGRRSGPARLFQYTRGFCADGRSHRLSRWPPRLRKLVGKFKKVVSHLPLWRQSHPVTGDISR